MAIQALDLVQMEVKDWSKIVDWYIDKLGLKVLVKEDDDKIAFLGFPEGEAKLALWGVDSVKVAKNRAYPCILTTDLDGVVAGLKKKGVEFEEEVTGGPEKGFRSARIWDPERNTVFLYEWCRR